MRRTRLAMAGLLLALPATPPAEARLVRDPVAESQVETGGQRTDPARVPSCTVPQGMLALFSWLSPEPPWVVRHVAVAGNRVFRWWGARSGGWRFRRPP